MKLRFCNEFSSREDRSWKLAVLDERVSRYCVRNRYRKLRPLKVNRIGCTFFYLLHQAAAMHLHSRTSSFSDGCWACLRMKTNVDRVYELVD